jgi:hypothetical protein
VPPGDGTAPSRRAADCFEEWNPDTADLPLRLGLILSGTRHTVRSTTSRVPHLTVIQHGRLAQISFRLIRLFGRSANYLQRRRLAISTEIPRCITQSINKFSHRDLGRRVHQKGRPSVSRLMKLTRRSLS